MFWGPTWHYSNWQTPQFCIAMTSLTVEGSSSETMSHLELVVHMSLTDVKNYCFPPLFKYFLAPFWVCCKTQGAYCLGTRRLINKNESDSSSMSLFENDEWDYPRHKPESQLLVGKALELIFSIYFFQSLICLKFLLFFKCVCACMGMCYVCCVYVCGMMCVFVCVCMCTHEEGWQRLTFSIFLSSVLSYFLMQSLSRGSCWFGLTGWSVCFRDPQELGSHTHCCTQILIRVQGIWAQVLMLTLNHQHRPWYTHEMKKKASYPNSAMWLDELRRFWRFQQMLAHLRFRMRQRPQHSACVSGGPSTNRYFWIWSASCLLISGKEENLFYTWE